MIVAKIPRKNNSKIGINCETSIECPHNKLIVHSNNVYQFIMHDHIIACYASSNYCEIITTEKKFLISKTLKWVYNKLPQNKFLRIHRSSLINIDHVHSIDTNNWLINLDNNTCVEVSRANRKILKTAILEN